MIHVACAADAAYLPHAAAMLQSLFARHRDATAHLLHGPDLPAAELDRLAGMCKALGGTLRTHPVDDAAVSGLPAMGRIPRVMWYRLFLPERLAGVSRALYLDCDTLVMDDLAPLFALDLDGAALGAVSNVFEQGMEQRASDLGLNAPRDYFNSGVLLMDLEAWRRDRLGEAVRAYALRHADHLVWPDQDALNTVFAGRWHRLHPRWNCQNSLYFFRQSREVFGPAAVDEALYRPAILHFEGGALAKPWHFLCKHPLRGEYHRRRAQTPWPTVSVEGRSLPAYALRPLPLPWQIGALRLGERLRRKWAALTA